MVPEENIPRLQNDASIKKLIVWELMKEKSTIKHSGTSVVHTLS